MRLRGGPVQHKNADHEVYDLIGSSLRTFVSLFILFLTWAQPLISQTLTVATVTRPPFSFTENGRDAGFSIELLEELTDRLGWEYEINRVGGF